MAASAAPQRVPQPPPRPPEPPAALRARVVEATRAIVGLQAQDSDAIASDAVVACRLLARAAIASSSTSTSVPSTPEDLRAIQQSLQDALALLDVAVAAASSSPSALALVAAALLLAGCSASVAPPLAVSSAAEVAAGAIDRLASCSNVVVLFGDKETAADASAGVGRLSAATAASSAAASASLPLLAFSRLAAASFARSIDSSQDESLESTLLVPVAHAAKMASSVAPPHALLPLLVEVSTRAAAEAASSSSDAFSASSAFLLAGLAEGAGPRTPSALPRELVEAVLGACERSCRNLDLLRRRRPPTPSSLERDAAASAAAAVAEAGAPSLPPSASAAMTSVLVSSLCECGGPLDLSRELFDAAARRSPPELAAAALLDPSKARLAKATAPRAARALATLAPSCPRDEAARCLERVAEAARGLHERYAEVAGDVDVDEGNKTTPGGAAWLSSPALSESGAIRGALDAAFFSCVAALRALVVPAGALPLPPGERALPRRSLDPRATAAALDALALVSFARPPAPGQQLRAHSDLVAGLLEAAAATGEAPPSPLAPGVGAALAERIPSYEFFVERQRWVSDPLLATRARFYLLCLAPAARGMSPTSTEERQGTTAASAGAATSKAAALALLYLGHPTSESLRGAAHGLCAALMDRGGPLSACPASSCSSSSFRGRRSAPLLLLPGFLDRALDLRGGVRPHYPGLAIAVAAALRGCQGGVGGGGSEAAAASLLVPRRLSSALRESLVVDPSPPSPPTLSPDSLALVSALASSLLSVDARGFEGACAAVEAALLPPSSTNGATPPLPSLPLPLSAAAFEALGRALGSADDLLRKPALARWWAGAASVVGVGAGR